MRIKVSLLGTFVTVTGVVRDVRMSHFGVLYQSSSCAQHSHEHAQSRVRVFGGRESYVSLFCVRGCSLWQYFVGWSAEFGLYV